MFKCSECQKEYKIKPEYCECGNDEFEEFENSISITTIQDRPSQKFTTNQIKKLFPISFIILCIIIAIIPWLFKNNTDKNSTPKVQKEITQNIPDIENIWENTQKENLTSQNKNSSQPAVIGKTEQPQKTVNNSPKKIQTSQKNKNLSTVTTNEKNKPQNKSLPQTNKISSTPKPTTETQKITQNKIQQNKNSTISSSQQPAPKQPEPPKMNAQEFLEYKGQIRSALLSKLNITAIQGGGDCAVEFSVDNSGKLINRNFIYKSSNKSLNDEIYLMLMRLPYFKTPPANYNGEKIKLKFYINNGYYEITFI